MKQNVVSIKEMKNAQNPITWLTCYEYSFASALNSTELDMILVGDSGGMVSLGYENTIPVTMDEMIQLASAVRRGAPDKFIVGDMPKGSYEASNREAVLNAMRFIKESGCDAVKLEGGSNMADRAFAIASAGIPTIGHIGLTPQTTEAFGGYRVVGRNETELKDLYSSAVALEEAGVFAILLEAVPPKVAKDISRNAETVIFGIGAGNFTHGQLLILHDLLGLYPKFRPKFAKCYVPEIINDFVNIISNENDLLEFGRQTRKDGFYELTRLAVNKFIQEVKAQKFPDTTYCYNDN